MKIEYGLYKYDHNCCLFFDKYVVKSSLEAKVHTLEIMMNRLSEKPNVFLACSFMKESFIIADVINRLRLDIPVIHIDFGITEEFTADDMSAYSLQKSRHKTFKAKNVAIQIDASGDIEDRTPIKQLRKFFDGYPNVKPIFIDGSYPGEACRSWVKFWDRTDINWGLRFHDYQSHYEIFPLWGWGLDDVLKYLHVFGLNDKDTVIYRSSKHLV